MRFHTLTAAAALALAALRPLAAQRSPAPNVLGACTYDSCALRVEPRFFASSRLVRGSTGVPVASVGLFGAKLEDVVQGADSAVRQAQRYRRAQVRGLVGTLGGAVLAAAALAQCDDDTAFILPACPTSTGALLLSGLAAEFYGGYELTRANRALARAVWWYNRALPR